MTNLHPRQIIEEPFFEEAKRALGHSAKRLDEILEGTHLRLCANAEGGHRIAGGVYVVRSQSFPDAPEVAVLYRFDEEHVYLLDIELY